MLKFLRDEGKFTYIAIGQLYMEDAAKYEKESSKKLLVRRIYAMIVSQMENRKKRIVAKDIRDRFEWFAEEFEYLVSSGIALAVHAVSNPSLRQKYNC